MGTRSLGPEDHVGEVYTPRKELEKPSRNETSNWTEELSSKERQISKTPSRLNAFFSNNLPSDPIAQAKNNPLIKRFFENKTVKTVLHHAQKVVSKIKNVTDQSHTLHTQNMQGANPPKPENIQKAIENKSETALRHQLSRIPQGAPRDKAIGEIYKNADTNGKRFLISFLANHYMSFKAEDTNSGKVNLTNRAIIYAGKLGREIEMSNPGLGKEIAKQITMELLNRQDVLSSLHGLLAESSAIQGNTTSKDDMADFLYTLRLEAPDISIPDLFSKIKNQGTGNNENVTNYIEYISDNLTEVPQGLLISEWFEMLDAARLQPPDTTKVFLKTWDRQFEIDTTANKIQYTEENKQTGLTKTREVPWTKPKA